MFKQFELCGRLVVARLHVSPTSVYLNPQCASDEPALPPTTTLPSFNTSSLLQLSRSLLQNVLRGAQNNSQIRYSPRTHTIHLCLPEENWSDVYMIHIYPSTSAITWNIQLLLQVLNFASVIASGLMMWKALGLLTNTESPIVVVLRYVRTVCFRGHPHPSADSVRNREREC